MRTKHLLFFYISIISGYMTTAIFKINFWAVYILSTLLYFGVICLVDRHYPLLRVAKRLHTGEREVGGDIARTIAVIFVPLIHFFGQTYYYYTSFDLNLFFPTMIRWLSLCAVPLFMIISGYFKSNADISKKHYLAVIPLLMTHIFITAIRLWVDYYLHLKPVDINYILDKLLYFEYGWYIRLYIGMLFIMPFFNMAYKALESRRKKEIFVLTLVFISSLGPVTFDVIPSSWLILYVFAYYIMGCYLHEYRVSVNKWLGIGIILGLSAFGALSTCLHSWGEFFDWSFIAYQNNSGYSSPLVFILSGLIMILCLNTELDIKPLNTAFKLISLVSLEMYLFSQLFDGFIYKDIIKNNAAFSDSFSRIILLVGASLVLSFIASWAKKGIFKAFIMIKGRTDKIEQQ